MEIIGELRREIKKPHVSMHRNKTVHQKKLTFMSRHTSACIEHGWILIFYRVRYSLFACHFLLMGIVCTDKPNASCNKVTFTQISDMSVCLTFKRTDKKENTMFGSKMTMYQMKAVSENLRIDERNV